jgi:hypothetical protein
MDKEGKEVFDKPWYIDVGVNENILLLCFFWNDLSILNVNMKFSKCSLAS